MRPQAAGRRCRSRPGNLPIYMGNVYNRPARLASDARWGCAHMPRQAGQTAPLSFFLPLSLNSLPHPLVPSSLLPSLISPPSSPPLLSSDLPVSPAPAHLQPTTTAALLHNHTPHLVLVCGNPIMCGAEPRPAGFLLQPAMVVAGGDGSGGE